VSYAGLEARIKRLERRHFGSQPPPAPQLSEEEIEALFAVIEERHAASAHVLVSDATAYAAAPDYGHEGAILSDEPAPVPPTPPEPEISIPETSDVIARRNRELHERQLRRLIGLDMPVRF
jgi:hypothetical protein